LEELHEANFKAVLGSKSPFYAALVFLNGAAAADIFIIFSVSVLIVGAFDGHSINNDFLLQGVGSKQRAAYNISEYSSILMMMMKKKRR